MRPEDIFFDGVTQIREELIEEAQRYIFRRRGGWMRYAGAAAACLTLVLGLSLLLRFGGAGNSGGSSGCDGGVEAGESSGDTAMPAEGTLIADVLEVLEDGSLLVVPQPGSGAWSVADRVRVPTEDVPDMPEVQAGNQILVVYRGEAGGDFLEGVVEIQILY